MAVDVWRQGPVGFVRLNNPPVNAIGLSIRQGLWDALAWVEAQEGLSRVVLHGSDRAFAAGADAREFDAPPVAPHLPDVLNGIEASEVPWVAAITGVALGGGCELALACRYRIAAPGVRIGLPEVTLGVVPGAGGTQRLPRLIGIAAAIEMISTGKPVTAECAEELGLIDGIADDPVDMAHHLDVGTLELSVPSGLRDLPAADDRAIDAARAVAGRKMANQIAPQQAIDLVALSTTTALPDGMMQERAVFLNLRQGAQARALRHMFFAERGARVPNGLKASTGGFDHVAVVGGGTMGAGIAYACLQAGLQVTLLEIASEAAHRARSNVERIIAASRNRGLISPRVETEIQARFDVSTDYDAASGADLAIEAAFESMDVKRDVFAALQAHLGPDTILATNTSYLDVNEIAEGLDDPTRVLGLHFFAPAHIMKLLEIVQGRATSDRALATGFALAKTLRKIPVRAGVCDGFIGNRLLARYREAADTVLMDGSTPWEIDEAMVDFGYAMGPYEAQDLSGLDIAFANRRRGDAARDPNRRYIPIADRMIELGKLGKKAGAGWYRYPGGGGKVEDPIVADLAIEEAYFAGITRRDFSADEIRNRLLCAMINEAVGIIEEGIASSACDIDLVTVFGYGFPRWRGGLMHYADTIGVESILERLDAYAQEDRLAWAANPALRHCAEQGLALSARFPG